MKATKKVVKKVAKKTPKKVAVKEEFLTCDTFGMFLEIYFLNLDSTEVMLDDMLKQKQDIKDNARAIRINTVVTGVLAVFVAISIVMQL